MITAAKKELHITSPSSPRDPAMMRLPSGERDDEEERPGLPSRVSAVKNHLKRLGPGITASPSAVSGIDFEDDGLDDENDDDDAYWEEDQEDVEEAMELEQEKRMMIKKRKSRVSNILYNVAFFEMTVQVLNNLLIPLSLFNDPHRHLVSKRLQDCFQSMKKITNSEAH